MEWLTEDTAAAGVTTRAAALVWVFRTDDCLTCQSFDYAVRRVQAAHGDSLPLIAVHVGSTAREQVPRSFFQARRIRLARQVTIAPRAFERTYGAGGLPALLVVRGHRVVWSSALPDGVATASQLDSLVRSVRAVAMAEDAGPGSGDAR